ncbi:hypothetical protein TNCV_3440241 [Trichonephila clavipes]|uniref:Uncharacterized protein n=1 Tax=Trichonephila clavipes TaxID=2585209 RepID=A0A8X6W5H3_TRICX|nr:hypothetical protein TNCV_3440241 [Trichonephila clavipes]
MTSANERTLSLDGFNVYKPLYMVGLEWYQDSNPRLDNTCQEFVTITTRLQWPQTWEENLWTRREEVLRNVNSIVIQSTHLPGWKSLNSGAPVQVSSSSFDCDSRLRFVANNPRAAAKSDVDEKSPMRFNNFGKRETRAF